MITKFLYACRNRNCGNAKRPDPELSVVTIDIALVRFMSPSQKIALLLFSSPGTTLKHRHTLSFVRIMVTA